MKEKLDVNILRREFDYDPHTGELKRGTRQKKLKHLWGKAAGFFEASTGYRRVCFQGTTYYVHRLVWFHFYGAMPAHEIDHINGDRLDNRIANLRDIPKKKNLQNRTKILSKTGFLGVTRKPGGKYVAQITVDGKTRSLGRFLTPQAAHRAYIAEKRRLHEGFVG